MPPPDWLVHRQGSSTDIRHNFTDPFSLSASISFRQDTFVSIGLDFCPKLYCSVYFGAFLCR